MSESEVEKENKALRAEVEELHVRISNLVREKQELESSLRSMNQVISTANIFHSKQYLAIKGLIEFIKNLNQLVSTGQIQQAKLQGVYAGLLEITQPYFHQSIEQVIDQLSAAQQKTDQSLLDHSNKQRQ